MKITGRIKDASFLDRCYPNDRYAVVSGFIYDDVRRRWPDGTPFWTSVVILILGNYVFTRNSIYYVENWWGK
jgi:hypothetical protein